MAIVKGRPRKARRRRLPPNLGERNAQTVIDALVIAIWRRGKPDALMHHSDRGSQYPSEQFQRLISSKRS